MVITIYSDPELQTKRWNTNKEICEMGYDLKIQIPVTFNEGKNIYKYDQTVYKKASCKIRKKHLSEIANYVNCELDLVSGYTDLSYGCKVRSKD